MSQRWKAPLHGVRAKFLTDIATRFLLQALSGAKGLVFLPLIAGTFGEIEYGIWTQISLTAVLAQPFLTLGLGHSLVRYLGGIPSGRPRGEAYYTVIWTVWIAGAGFIVLAWFLRATIGIVLFGDPALASYALLLAILIVAEVNLLTALAYFRSLGLLKLGTAIQAGTTLVTIGIVAAAVVGFDGDLHAGVAAWTASMMAGGVLAQIVVVRKEGFQFRVCGAVLRRFLHYSIPLIPAAASAWILEYSDRYVIVHLLGLGEAGVYAGSYKLAQVVRMLMLPISFVLLPTTLRLWEARRFHQVRRFMRASLAGYVVISGWVAVLLVALGPRLLHRLGTSGFDVPEELIALLVVGEMFLSIRLLYTQVLYLRERTRTVMAIVLATAGMNIALNLLLIPKMGILGAAIATSTSYAVQLLLMMVAAQRSQLIGIPIRSLARILAGVGLMYVIVRFTSAGGIEPITLSVVGGSFVYAGILFSSRAIRTSTRQFLVE